MSKEKEDNTSVESSERKKKIKRLEGMLESMNSRSDPVSTHRIATEYFQTFKILRNIKDINTQSTAVDSAVDTAVSSAVDTDYQDKYRYKDSNNEPKVDLLHTSSEDKVYNTIKNEISRLGVNNARIGITKLKNITKLSDKTIRVAIHNLEKKKSLRIVKPSMGIYGRMFSVLEPDEIFRERNKEAVIIDKTTKSIIPR